MRIVDGVLVASEEELIADGWAIGDGIGIPLTELWEGDIVSVTFIRPLRRRDLMKRGAKTRVKCRRVNARG
jgi:hypothetical protein